MLTHDATEIGVAENEIKEKCTFCKFFEEDNEMCDFGLCRRHAPMPIAVDAKTITTVFAAWWPSVENSDFCGDFEIANRCIK